MLDNIKTLVDETPVMSTHVVPSVEYCHVPLPLAAKTASPCNAPVSTSAYPSETLPSKAETVVELDGVSSFVDGKLTLTPLLIVGASLREVTTIWLLAICDENAVVLPPTPGLANEGVPFVDAVPLVWSQATNVKFAVSPLLLSPI